MQREERLTLAHLEKTRSLPAQVLMRQAGLIEAKPRAPEEGGALDGLEDTQSHIVNRARANLHVVEMCLVQPEREVDSDDEQEQDGEADDEEALVGGKLPPLPKLLSVDLEKFPAAIEINCSFAPCGAVGMRLLANHVAEPPAKGSAFLASKAAAAGMPPQPVLVPNLLHLNLARNNILRMGARALAATLGRGAFPKLKTLDLRSNMIEDCGVKAICDVANKGTALRHLRTLCLRQNGIGDSGACALAHTLLQTHLPALQVLDLKMNRVRFRGAHALLSFLDSTCRHKRFRELNLSGNFVDRRRLGRFAMKGGAPKGAIM